MNLVSIVSITISTYDKIQTMSFLFHNELKGHSDRKKTLFQQQQKKPDYSSLMSFGTKTQVSGLVKVGLEFGPLDGFGEEKMATCRPLKI